MESHTIVYRDWNNQSNAIANCNCFIYLHRNRDAQSVWNIYVHFNRNVFGNRNSFVYLYLNGYAESDRNAYEHLRIHVDPLKDGYSERASNDDAALHGNGVADAQSGQRLGNQQSALHDDGVPHEF